MPGSNGSALRPGAILDRERILESYVGEAGTKDVEARPSHVDVSGLQGTGPDQSIAQTEQ